QLRPRLLEHDDSLPVPRAAGCAEGGFASARQDAARLYQRGLAQLGSIREVAGESSVCPLGLSLHFLVEPECDHRWLSQLDVAIRADPAAYDAHALQAECRFVGARAE